jgi:hypothetical protein
MQQITKARLTLSYEIFVKYVLYRYWPACSSYEVIVPAVICSVIFFSHERREFTAYKANIA